MAKEYLGVNAVTDLFDIIDENYVSKEAFETKEKEIASAICVGSALIAKSILNVAEAIMALKGGEGGDTVDETRIATEEDVDEILNQYLNTTSDSSTTTQASVITANSNDDSSIDESALATDGEIKNVLNRYFN